VRVAAEDPGAEVWVSTLAGRHLAGRRKEDTKPEVQLSIGP